MFLQWHLVTIKMLFAFLAWVKEMSGELQTRVYTKMHEEFYRQNAKTFVVQSKRAARV